MIETDDFKEELFKTFVNIEFSFSASGSVEGIGTLFITTARIIWMSDASTLCYDFDVPYIVLHAITHDESTYPKPCLYCQLGSADDNDSDAENFQECYFAPTSELVLNEIFGSFSEAAERNPDDDDSASAHSEGELIYDLDEVELGAVAAKRLRHLESVFNTSDVAATSIQENPHFDDAVL